jgi:hypothetical protein
MTAGLPLDESEVAARVAAGELVRLDVAGKAPVRAEMLETLRARLARQSRRAPSPRAKGGQ